MDSKYKIFQAELDTIQNQDIKEYAIELLNKAPNYFFNIAASSTGKYHPKYALGDGGLVRHTKALVRFANHLFELEQYHFFTDREKDLIRVGCLIHDSKKSGEMGSMYTVFDHPILAGKSALEDSKRINEDERQFVYNIVASHMGQWNTTKRSTLVLPKPTTEAEKFLHMCDYLASRKDIEVLFESAVEINSEPQKAEDFVLTFGKYKGKKLSEIAKLDKNYMDWLKTNITKDPIASYIKEITA